MMISRCLVAATATLFVSFAVAQSGPAEVTAAQAQAFPTFAVTPELPDGEALTRYPTIVEIRGTISAEGKLLSPRYMARDGDDVFVNVVKEVIERWRFKPAIDRIQCAPTASETVLKIIFRIQDGKPEVALPTFEPSAVAAASPGGLDGTAPRRWLVVPHKISYPTIARRQGIEGTSELLAKVNAEGEFLEPKIRYSSPMRAFGEAAMAGVVAARVNKLEGVAESERARTWCFAIPSRFCLTPDARVADISCKPKESNAWPYGLVINKRTAESFKFLGE